MDSEGTWQSSLKGETLGTNSKGWHLAILICSAILLVESPGYGALLTMNSCIGYDRKSCIGNQDPTPIRTRFLLASETPSLHAISKIEAESTRFRDQEIRLIEKFAIERSLASFSAADTVIAFSSFVLTVVGLLLTATGILGFSGVRQLQKARETLDSINIDARAQSEGLQELVHSLQKRADEASIRIDELRSYIERESRTAVLASFEMSQGRLCFEHGDCSRAIQHYSKALDYRPDETTILVDIGRCYVHLKENQKATNFFKRALKKDKSLAEAHFGIATAYRLTNLTKALSSIETAIALTPNNYNYYDFRAAIQRAEKNYCDAELSYMMSFELKPMHDSAMWLACLAKLRGDSSQYQHYLEEAFILAIEDVKVGFRAARAEFTLWFVYLARGHIDEANQAISRISAHGVSRHLVDLLIINIDDISQVLALSSQEKSDYISRLRQSASIQSQGNTYA